MSSIDEIKAGLEQPAKLNPMMPVIPGVQEIDVHKVMAQEIIDLRTSMEAILIWLKITNRLSEAQYSFVFGHVASTQKPDDEDLGLFLTRSAIELEKKMKDAGLI